MTGLLNEIIVKGGTTAHTKAFDSDMLGAEMRLYPGQTAWVLAENNIGDVLGFQNIMPHKNLPDDAADIATFVKLGQPGLVLAQSSLSARHQRHENWATPGSMPQSAPTTKAG